MNSIIVLISAVFITICNAQMLTDVVEAFREHQVEPDSVSVSPTRLVTVDYPSGVSAELGNELTPTQVIDQPTLHWDAEDGVFYTIYMSDLDLPSRATPTFREGRHWVVVNIPDCSIDEGDTITEYFGPAPSEGTGLHRYVFLVYRQPNGIFQYDEPFTSNRSADNRASTSAESFSRKYNLGDPEFGNLFQAQYDDSVPIIQAQLGVI